MVAAAVDETFRIAGFVLSRTSVHHLIGGVPYTGVVEVSGLEQSREGEFVWGARGDGTPLGVTSGLFTPGPFSFKALIDTGTAICEQIMLLGLGSFGNALFPWIIEIEETPSLTSLNIAINNVKIEKQKFSVPTGAEPLMMEFECKHQGFTVSGVGAGPLTGVPTFLQNVLGL